MSGNAIKIGLIACAAALSALPYVASAAEGLDTLSPDYLEGRWCYAFIDFGGQREDVSVAYVFAADGSLEYQNSSTSSTMSAGSYELNDGRMKIKPALTFFDFVVDSVDENRFVLDAMGGKHHFVKAACR